MSIYSKQTTTAQSWYGNTVAIPQLNSPSFVSFVSSCMGIVSKLAHKKYDQVIKVGMSHHIDTAYADPDKHLIVISNRFLRGDFSAIGFDRPLNAPKTVGALLGIIVHEVGHFAYSPRTLEESVNYIKARTKKHFNAKFAHRIANTVEDIYIEYQIARNAPTLAWSLQEVNKLMLTDEKFQESGKSLKNVSFVENAIQANDIANLLLFAKVTSKTPRGLSSFVSALYAQARTATKLYDLTDRNRLSLALYDAIMPEMSKQTSSSQSKNAPQKPNDDDDQDDENSQEDTDDQDSTDSDDQDSNDQDDESEDSTNATDNATDDATDDEIDQEDTEDDQEDTDGFDDDSENSDDQDSDDDQDGDSSGESDDQENDSDSDSDSDSENSESENGQEKEETDNQFSPESFDQEYNKSQSDNDTIIDGYKESQRDTPEFVEMDIDGFKSIDPMNGNTILEMNIPLHDTPFPIDVRFNKLAEVARQRASSNRPYGEQRDRGRNLRQIHRIATDHKIFATPIQRENFQPMDVKIMLDCSSSMIHTTYVDNVAMRKIDAAISATLGAANGLINGRCMVNVYGHTADNKGGTKQLVLYPLYRNGESINTLARRLTELSTKFWRTVSYSGATYAGYSLDGYCLYTLSRKFDNAHGRKKVIIVISDGEPNAPDSHYTDYAARKHCKEMVDRLRSEGYTILSLSIDPSAFRPNNFIYGENYNVNSSDPNIIDQIIAKLMNV